MRIQFERLLPKGGRESREEDLLSFIQNEADLGMFVRSQKRLPSLQQINEVLGRGLGDDGFIAMVWQPFELSSREYSDLERQLRHALKP